MTRPVVLMKNTPVKGRAYFLSCALPEPSNYAKVTLTKMSKSRFQKDHSFNNTGWLQWRCIFEDKDGREFDRTVEVVPSEV